MPSTTDTTIRDLLETPDEELVVRCERCGSDHLHYVETSSTEPHGETFTDRGYECEECGAITEAA